MSSFNRILGQASTAGPRSPQPTQGGVVTAIVTDDIDPQNRGRVRVAFPTGAGGRELSPVWAPVAVPFAGDNYGAYMIPGVVDQVVVGFFSNDERQPVVLGALWNGAATPSESAPQNGIEKWSMTGRQGTRIAIVEEGGTPKVEMHTQQGISITVSDEGGGTITLSSGGSTIEMTPSEISMNTSTMSINAAQYTLTAGTTTFDTAMATCTGVMKSEVCLTNSVIASTYTPGAGNIW